MPIGLSDARRIAVEVIEANHPDLKVIGAATAEGGSSYTEIILSITNCHAEPCRITIGVQRDLSEAAFRAAVSEQLRRHIQDPQSMGD